MPNEALRLFEPGTPVAALPSWDTPRLLVPTETAPQRWEASAFYPAHRVRARLFRWGLRAAVGLGAFEVRRAPDSSEPLLAHLRGVWPEADRMAVQLGAPGQAQIWTAKVRAATGRVIGYVKGGTTPLAVQRLKAEAHVLPYVPAGRGPELVWDGPWARGYILAVTPVSGRPIYPQLSPPPELAAFADALVLAPPRPLERHPWAARLPRHHGLAAALKALSGRSWPVVVQHGDCAPWNLHRCSRGIVAFDWEFGNPAALPYLDEAFFILQTAYHLHDWEPSQAVEEAARYLQQRALTAREARAIVTLAAFDAWRKAIPLRGTSRLQEWRRRIWEA